MKSDLLGCGILLAVPLGILFIVGSLNYSGFCWSEMRYLSDEEKFRMVFERVNSRKNIRIKTKDKRMQSKRYERVKYKNFDEFMEKNPDCCAIDPPNRGLPLRPPSFVNLITGFDNAEIIVIDYTDRYIDENGDLKYKKSQITSVLKNCGELRDL